MPWAIVFLLLLLLPSSVVSALSLSHCVHVSLCSQLSLFHCAHVSQCLTVCSELSLSHCMHVSQCLCVQSCLCFIVHMFHSVRVFRVVSLIAHISQCPAVCSKLSLSHCMHVSQCLTVFRVVSVSLCACFTVSEKGQESRLGSLPTELQGQHSFITECFHLTQRALSVTVIPAIKHYNKMHR